MFPGDYLIAGKKFTQVYEDRCIPVCKQFGLNQSALDLILFIANNPQLNTARDVCEIRGIKKGIVSVTVENLVTGGFLHRENDTEDRRIQRLQLTSACKPIVDAGRKAQTTFLTELSDALTPEELTILQQINQKLMAKVSAMQSSLDANKRN